MCVITIFPFINALAYSLSDPLAAMRGGISVYPKGFTLRNYELVLSRKDLLPAAVISVGRVVFGILWHVSITGIASYALSKKTLPFNRTITIILIIPMYVNAGLIPQYVNINDLGLMNQFWVYIIPHAFGAYIMLIMRTYFQGISPSIFESALIDGASEIKIFIRIVIPLSMPIIAVAALFQGVWQWNEWFDAMLYVVNVRLHPLSMLLQRIIRQNETSGLQDAMAGGVMQLSPQSIRMTMLLVITLPIVIIYPIFQRYFVKGVMIGAVKG